MVKANLNAIAMVDVLHSGARKFGPRGEEEGEDLEWYLV